MKRTTRFIAGCVAVCLSVAALADIVFRTTLPPGTIGNPGYSTFEDRNTSVVGRFMDLVGAGMPPPRDGDSWEVTFGDGWIWIYDFTRDPYGNLNIVPAQWPAPPTTYAGEGYNGGFNTCGGYFTPRERTVLGEVCTGGKCTVQMYSVVDGYEYSSNC